MKNLFKTSIEKNPFNLKKGDIMMHRSLGEIYFDEWSRGMNSYHCVQISTGTRYKIKTPKLTLNGEYINFKVIGQWEFPKVQNDAKKLKKGDLFIIERKNACEIFKFIDYGKTGKIIASSPLDDNKRWNIDKTFTCVKVDNL